jgi:hypothetical protein
MIIFRRYLKRYQACADAAEVRAAQELIENELEEEHARAREEKGWCAFDIATYLT